MKKSTDLVEKPESFPFPDVENRKKADLPSGRSAGTRGTQRFTFSSALQPVSRSRRKAKYTMAQTAMRA